ncbi:MAG: nicotinate (nicotinamide) nucleotide adenylyltransferase [Deltaproteobacteria bacterium]|nr:nicotinate (nicotinamide) nucleotide adenylyltransferase [Deltaproteobacteria bacterium]
MHVAIFGGSFDPPHVGHMMACYYVLDAHGADEIWMVPVFRHPFGKELAPYDARVEMCEMAIPVFGGRVKVMRFEEELSRGGAPVYTVDLLAEMRRRYPEHTFSFIVGSDGLAERHGWKDFEQIRSLARLIILRRRGFDDAAEDHKMMLPEISSTWVRDAVRRGLSIEGLVPLRVLRYIQRERLYKGN